ncbi:dolichyl-phosphate beta-D-mannosyltransferase [Ascoidea rubescens DSM 1968]|uniref:Dolichol-phosphate mannosyltransferase subunit 1 n=1 Tax=Ascoidea rubescens DSM 1968 TaxID=1344418 RepID=A0A1D2VCH4_9ASCO|nr:glycosyltransferase family 2 protein [Ascoidea rubescens DSM 1968]ODV59424.1 glycosyltransferase family 2 protein [Ascoidea rubescens DSM 1968]
MSKDIKFSVIVPSYHEKLNIEPLTTRLFQALGPEFSKQTELIYVDDNSQDGSVEEVQKLSEKGYNVRIIVRTKERGLSSAVLHGFKNSDGQYLLCMDADLQHPPEVVPKMLDSLVEHPFALGTRYAKGVEMDKNWPIYRRIISSGARLLALPLTSASDPMSGFFGVQRKYLYEVDPNAINNINDKGFKIALELLAKLPLPKKDAIGDVPFSFGVRTEGESKLSGKVMFQYLGQLRDLYCYKFGGFHLVMGSIVLTLLFLGTVLLYLGV